MIKELVILTAVFILCSQAVFSDGKPAWFDKTIIPEGAFISAVGHSQPRKTELEAKEDALGAATKEFIRYCRVSVDSFDRSIEMYSKAGGKEFKSMDLQTQNTVRAKAFVSRVIPEDWYVTKTGGGFAASVIIKVPKEEFDRISSENNVKLSLDVLFYYENEKGRMLPVSEGAVLKSGDGYALYVKPGDTCYLYVYQIDSLGKSFRLFPAAGYKTASNPVSAAADLWIPNDKSLFTLDEVTGKEYFYLFASPQPIREFEGDSAAKLDKSDIDNIVSLKKMGVAGLKPKREPSLLPPSNKSGLDVLEVKKKLQSEGAFVYETWFWHK